MSHRLTFAARAWRDSAGATAGELLILFEPRAAANHTGTRSLEALFLHILDRRPCVGSVFLAFGACWACRRWWCLSTFPAATLNAV